MYRNSRNRHSLQPPRGRKSFVAPEYVIPLKPDFDLSKVTKIKHTKEVTDPNGGTEKTTIYIPQLPEDATPYQQLSFFSEFQDAIEIMEWTTGATKFSKIGQHFQGIHRSNCVSAISDIGNGRSNAAFNQACEVFLSNTFEASKDYDTQLDYLRSIKKPSDLDPKMFRTLLEIANKQVNMLPGAPAHGGLSDDEMKKTYLHAMPSSWQTNFRNAGLTYRGTSITAMVSYFSEQAQMNPFVPRINTSDTSNEARLNRPERAFNRYQNSQHRGNTRTNRSNRHTSFRTQNNQGHGVNVDRPCPLQGHAGHTIRECRVLQRTVRGDATQPRSNSRTNTSRDHFRPRSSKSNNAEAATKANRTSSNNKVNNGDAFAYCGSTVASDDLSLQWMLTMLRLMIWSLRCMICKLISARSLRIKSVLRILQITVVLT